MLGAPVLGKLHRRAILPERFGRGFQYSHQFKAVRAAAQRLRALPDAVEEMLALRIMGQILVGAAR